MSKESVGNFWAKFCSSDSGIDETTPYQVWHFGNTREMASDLLRLVLSGKKTATASSLAMNELKPDDAPVPSGYSVVTDYDGEPACVIQTTEIRHVPFDDVDPEFAAEEGEGDLSLEYWRRVHWDYFTREGSQYGYAFDERSIVCCERFRLVYSG